MKFETYWTIVPIVSIGLPAFGWLALWLTRRRENAMGSASALPVLRC